jgi:AraC-like DNA-binding protein
MLVSGCVAPRRERDPEADSPLSSLLIERARHVVRQNMASPDFGPGQLVRLLAVSRSKLYRSLETSGGVAAFIQRERLHQARRFLSDPSDTRSVNVIAAEVGFLDHSTFSRAFRREFDLSPSESREMALARRVVGWQATTEEEGAAVRA